MYAGFGESEYQYACVREMEEGAAFGLKLGQPVFPTLRQEAAVGADVFFRPEGWHFLPLCFQFKTSQYIDSRRSRFIKTLNGPYYRFDIWPKTVSPQHNTLVRMAHRGFPAFYCAPGFHTWGDFASLYNQRRVVMRSTFVWCGGLPNNQGGKWHSVSFNRLNPDGRWASEEIQVGLNHGLEGLSGILRELNPRFLSLEEIVAAFREEIERSPRVTLPSHFSDLPAVSRDLMTLTKTAADVYGISVGFVFKSFQQES